MREVRVQGGGGLVGHVGLHALGAFADRLGPAASLSPAVRWAGERAPVHDRGKVLTQAMLMLAGGGEAWADIEYLRAEEGLFGAVPSAPTLYRTVRALDPATVGDLWAAHAAVREEVWARRAPDGAAANNIDDHIDVLDAAVGRLPAAVYVGHRAGDDADLATRPVVLRADSAGCSTKIAEACRDRNVGYSLVARRNDAIDSAIAAVAVTDKCWQPAIKQNGDVRPRAVVADLTDYIDTSDWPPGTRLIVRREPRHPGAQRSLFGSDNWRYWGHWTDHGASAVDCDAHMRAHAVVEDHIGALKTAGLLRLPFADFDANAARVALICWAPTHQPSHHTSPASTTTSLPSTDTGGEGHKNTTTATTNHPAGQPHAPPHRPQPPNNTPPHPKPTIKHPTNTQHPAQRPQQEPNHPPNHSHEQSGLNGNVNWQCSA